MPKLGINVDHIATLRQARRGIYPDPVRAALICEEAGCDSIVAHLREDRRHINDNDVQRLKRSVKTRFNLEMSISPEIVDIACNLKPNQATLVPERRQELTTEGGLDVIAQQIRLKKTIKKLSASGLEVSLFIDPNKRQIAAAANSGAKIIEIHTGHYADARSAAQRDQYYKQIMAAVDFGRKLGLIVNAGHGLGYDNTKKIAEIEGIYELNIGYSIICRSVFSGLKNAVKEMLCLTK